MANMSFRFFYANNLSKLLFFLSTIQLMLTFAETSLTYINPNNMKNIFKAVAVIFCLFICAHTALGNTTATHIDNILIINAYSESNPWSNSFINPIVNMASQDDKLGVSAVHLKLHILDSPNDLQELEEKLFNSTQRPKLIVLIGCGSFILCENLNRQWPDIPMILCGERDYTGDKKIVAQGNRLTPEQRIPVTSLHKKFNLTFMQSSVYLEENLQLIKQLIPQMNEVMYIGDETYICQQNDYDFATIVHKKYPELKYRFLSAKDIKTDSLFSILSRIDPHKTGVIFSSWLRKNSSNDMIMMTNSHRIISTTSVPLFSIRAIGIEEEGGIVGGYIYNKKNFTDRLLESINKILNGEQARSIPFYYPADGAPTFNYQSLLQRNLSTKNCPKNTIFYNMPPSYWEKYEYIIIGTIFFLILLIIVFQYHRLHVLQKIKKLQQRELDTSIKYSNLVNTMPILYMYVELVKDKDGHITDIIYADVNKHFEDKAIKRENIIGKRRSELFPESMPDFLHFMNIALKEKRAVTFSYYYKSLNNFFEIVVKASDDEKYMHTFCIDSTELHHTQMQLRSTNRKLSLALEVANIVPWKWNIQTHTILCDVNRPIELSDNKHHVNDEQLSVPDSQYFSKIYKEDLAKVKQAYADLIEGRILKVKEEYRIVNQKDGHKCLDWVEAQAAVETYDKNGKPLTLVGSSLVITERKKMETELVSAKNRAEESNKLKSAFLANMSHEIRTPLNAIVGFSGILASTEEEEEKQEYVSIIENNNTLLLQLISDILDLSKIEAGTMEFIYKDMDLNKVMTELESSLRLKLSPEKDVKLIFEPGLPDCQIHSERNRLSQLIINLVTNAIKFTEQGSIRFGYKLQEDNMLYFYVIDSGCGIPEDKQGSIFDRFVKLNSFAQGTGLGLAICQTLVQHMGGKIGLTSKPNVGSTFWFTLPYLPATNIRPTELKAEPIKLKKQKITILVAEDHDSNYRLIESILKKDYNLIHAWNGEEAVTMFKEYAPQLILMDINMPVMDGYEATKEIRKYSTQVPIIAVTAFAYTSDEQKVMENGFDAYMAKPINAGQLKRQITSMLTQHIIFM